MQKFQHGGAGAAPPSRSPHRRPAANTTTVTVYKGPGTHGISINIIRIHLLYVSLRYHIAQATTPYIKTSTKWFGVIACKGRSQQWSRKICRKCCRRGDDSRQRGDTADRTDTRTHGRSPDLMKIWQHSISIQYINNIIFKSCYIIWNAISHTYK